MQRGKLRCYKRGMFMNTVLRKVFVPEREEVRGGWKKLHNEECHDFYYLSDIIWVIK
jgi:hypothetical protein